METLIILDINNLESNNIEKLTAVTQNRSDIALGNHTLRLQPTLN